MPDTPNIRYPSEAVRNFRAALVTMPFASSFRPSIQLGLLKAIGRRAGLRVDDHYLNLDLAVQLGFDFYTGFEVFSSGNQIGEWLFSIAAFGEEASRSDYLTAFPLEPAQIAQNAGKDAAYLTDLRERVLPKFIDDCLCRIDWGSYGAVGFTSSYQQHVASLALARGIKERFPHIAIIFGGANMDGRMGLEHMRAFPFIDYGVSGDGDGVFPELLARLAEGRAADDLLGVIARRGGEISFLGPAEQVRNLDDLPMPDYDTYFAAVRQYRLDKAPGFTVLQQARLEWGAIPIEGSRGCWWGEKSHCTFCGLNGASISFRSKSPERMLAEMDALSRSYSGKNFWASDNILDLKYIDGVFRLLAARNEGYRIGFEVKSNLTREQIRILAKGGMTRIQPGIESLSTHILKLMRKGVTKLQNVNLLRWCAYYGIDCIWNLIAGFPGETPEDYAEQLDTLRLLAFVSPPNDCARLMLDRFSPYFCDDELFPTKWRRPEPSYAYVYPDRLNLEETAYFFAYECAGDVVPEEALTETQALIRQRRSDWLLGRRPTLTYRRSASEIVIHDTRFTMSQPRTYTLPGGGADVYEACISMPRTPAQICASLRSEHPSLIPDEDAVAAACRSFCAAGLMIADAGKYLSLALPADPET